MFWNNKKFNILKGIYMLSGLFILDTIFLYIFIESEQFRSNYQGMAVLLVINIGFVFLNIDVIKKHIDT